MIKMKLPDILDRLAICILKQLRTGESQISEIVEYLEYLQNNEIVVPSFIELLAANNKTWDLEKDIRAGVNDIGLEEIGRLALLVRDSNKARVSIKNRLVEETGEGYKDIKVNYGANKNETNS